MKKIDYSLITYFINPENILSSGKEVSVYYYGEKVIKIFHKDRKTPIKRISDEGLITLSQLSLNCFNTPVDVIMENDKIVGYTENYLLEEEFKPDSISFLDIKEDLITLSDNGFCIEDLFYNYIFSSGKLWFTDLTCYQYIPTNVDFLKQRFLQKNIDTMNTFLIGLLLFDAFKKGEKAEYTKIYKANEYRNQFCGNSFYGDSIEQRKTK